ncbi:MAG: bifunctional adenosylcobinamide kinase/adenosylcobinamide-phosphate guanylyltransferase [Gammaproteobacteria bacterium]|nr:bifunctional adenosylcobinamide kinase/adenosylcobinamide-phosphate guanylyltransferase [Gammaproteobacteria bacterium]
MKQLVLGGARSGKSRHAEKLAEKSTKSVFYLATANAGDSEMSSRIALHQQQRPAHWQLIEEELFLAKALQKIDAIDHCILVDCLTLWVSNLLCHNNAQLLAEQKATLINMLPNLKSDIIFVSNEVGHGIVPMGELNRRFVDESGWLHQDLTTACDKVDFVMAGLPLSLK